MPADISNVNINGDEQGRENEIEVIKGNGEFTNQLKLRISAPQEFEIVRGKFMKVITPKQEILYKLAFQKDKAC